VSDYTPDTYGERIAAVYDELYPDCAEVAVEVLAGLARGGRALELGIGTGRVAVPLAGRGVDVHGIDASPSMVERLRSKLGGDRFPVTLGDFAAVEVEGAFSLIFVVVNTFFCLQSQVEQVRCFRNVAAHLREDGVFLLDVFVPDVARYVRGQCVQTAQLDIHEVNLDVTRHDPVEQRVFSQHIRITEDGTRLYPVQLRYAWPAELDLMAQLAGLRLRSRWGGWDREPFTAASTRHVSVYERE
jgi:SAM-dependent methyltransferase